MTGIISAVVVDTTLRKIGNHNMDSNDNMKLAVSVLTAIMSGQDDVACDIVEENNMADIVSALVGISFSSLSSLSLLTGVPVETYLQQLGRIAITQ